MYAFRIALTLVGTAVLALGSSVARNPLRALSSVRNPSILTANHRVTALSTFDLAFDFYDDTRVRLHLEPNHDIIPEGATVQYLAPDGSVDRIEPIDRLEHKVFKGTAWIDRDGALPMRVGWSRIVVRRDGVNPLFEGAFTVKGDHHHIQMASTYERTRHDLDPTLELSSGDDEFMVVFRDSDIHKNGYGAHTELKRQMQPKLGCRSDSLSFNMQPDHPVKMMRRDDNFWGMPVSSLFGKRQIDNQPGGNSAGVNLVESIGSTAGCPTTRRVALVGVATDCTYTGDFNSSESARQNVITQMNSASDLYENTFNISLGLANLTVSDANCPGTPPDTIPWNIPCSSNTDIQDRLNLFSGWRGQQEDGNSHWTLLTTCNTGSAVGLAWLGQACVSASQNSSSGGQDEIVSGANVVVRTSTEWQVIAHETGHTFGAVHDCTTSTCSDGTSVNAQQCCPLSANTCDAGERFIMNPSTAEGITEFSPCSVGNICSAMGRNSVKTDCFRNNRGVTTITGQQCGNGIVEDGEDCDCGGEDGCGDNACCDAATCKFKNNAVCDDSNEDCCRNCQFASSDTVCRASTGDCDPEERCPGDSPYCPEDQTTDDGEDCGDGLQCASGQCTSRDLQCKTVMGSYTQGNDTYACDSATCRLSCASPEFGAGVCYGLQQNFLDGTECGGGGRCDNGICQGSSVAREVGSWINDHKPLVIGIACAIGGLFLIMILGCIVRCFRRRRYPQRAKTWPGPHPQNGYWAANGVWVPTGGRHRPHGGSRTAQFMSQVPGRGHRGQPTNAWYGPPPPTYSGRTERYA
ncbi:Metallo-peptidase family M12-domain-containing protein [Lineolata rhizophorae]|uniref:Disintegrin and metalloproteinase domain-containing protein B n=1 Tax=Lineolata rhizophorae TaxID=578093 RepID=A0A6A6P9S1_9PEZI|nr:Metallo-peptidase family M12-domain-containing protein [Lineolata rhizophorae]